MHVHGLDISDCFDCPMLAGLTDEQKREQIRTDPLIARCLANRKAVAARPRPAKRKRIARAPELCQLEAE